MFAKTRTSFLTRSSRVNETKIWGFRFRIQTKIENPQKGGVLVSLARELRVKIVPPNRVLVTICALILGMYGNTGTENNPHRFQRTITVSFKL